MLEQEFLHFAARQERLGSIRNSVLEVVDHALVEIELHRHAGGVEGLVEADEAAQQRLLQAALDQCRREALAEIAVHGRGVGVLLVRGIGEGDPVTSGYSSYGSIGNYLITGNLVPAVAPIAVASATPASGLIPLTVNFSSAGSNDPDGTIVSYAWDFGNGATSTAANPSYVYTIAGSYTATLTVTDNMGITTPTTVAITASAPTAPQITTQPTNQTVNAGANVSFSVVATGTATLTYQWKKNGVNIGGATSATYTIPTAATGDAGTYTVQVSGTCAPSVTSTGSVLNINEQPEVLSVTGNQTVCEGSSVTFTVNAGVTTSPTYQWRFNGTPIGGATSSSYTIATTTTGDAGNYDVVVTGDCGSVTSATALLTFNPATAVSVNPQNLTVCMGSAASFSVTATGTGTLSYQWRKDLVNINGATSSTYSIPVTVAGDAGNYDVVVTGDCGAVTSSTAVLTVSALPSITGTTPGTRCGTGTVVLGATGTGAAVNWYTDANAIGYLGTGNSFTTPPINTTTTFYAAAVSNSFNNIQGLGNTSIPPDNSGWVAQRGIAFNAGIDFIFLSAQYYSSTINITNQVHVVLKNSSGTALHDTTLQIVQGTSPDWYTMNLNWFISAGNGYRLLADFSGAVQRDLAANYSLPAYNNLSPAGIITSGIESDGSISTNTYNYFHNISILAGCISPASPVTATVTPAPAITVSPASYSVCSGNNSSTQISVSSGNDPNYTYNWTSVPAGFTATGAGPFTVAPTVTTTYFVAAQDNTTGNPNSGCFATGSGIVNINRNILAVSPTASPATVCTGGNTQLNANAGISFCTPVTSCTFPDIISNVSFGGINNTTGCNGASSGGYTYFTTPNPTIAAGTTVPLSVTTSGDLEGAAVWIDYNHNGSFESSEQVLNGYLGTNPATYSANVTIPSTALNGLTRMRVRCTFFQNPNSLADPSCSNSGYGETEDYAITINGGTDPDGFTYDWSANPLYLDATNISNPYATGITAAQTYTVTVTDPGTGCVKTGSVNVPINLPFVVINGAICSNGSGTQLTTVTAPGTGGSSISSYQWFLDDITISGATASTYTATVPGSYKVAVTSNIGCSVISDPFVISVLTGGGLNGTYTINSSLPASCSNYLSLASAIADLNTYGVSGNVIFNINSGHTETAPAGGLVINYCGLAAGLKPSATQTVRFQGGATAALITAPVGTTTNLDAIISLVGADWITFDKVNVQESVANSTATTQME